MYPYSFAFIAQEMHYQVNSVNWCSFANKIWFMNLTQKTWRLFWNFLNTKINFWISIGVGSKFGNFNLSQKPNPRTDLCWEGEVLMGSLFSCLSHWFVFLRWLIQEPRLTRNSRQQSSCLNLFSGGISSVGHSTGGLTSWVSSELQWKPISIFSFEISFILMIFFSVPQEYLHFYLLTWCTLKGLWE